MKILIIEDEKMLANSLADLLRDKGFEAEAVYDGESGADYALTGVYDLLILDVMMPGMNGLEVARAVRAKRNATPILMLTARSAIEDRIAGLNAGADYYLTKPFDSRELLACVNALLRRQGNEVDELRYGNTSLDLSTSTLICGEREVRLSAREFDVMRALMQAGSGISARRRSWPGSGALIPTPWRTMWRSTPAFCARSWRPSAPTWRSSPSGGWGTIWR